MNRLVRPAPPRGRAAAFAAFAEFPWLASALLLGAAPVAVAAPAIPLASYPLFLTPPLAPNVLVLLDNSGSMDATMAGKVVSGDDPLTRGNIARSVLRNVIDANRFGFNWGLGTFDLSGSPALFNTMAQFVGSASTMVYTNDCKLSAGSLFDLSGPPDATGYSAAGPQTVSSAPGVTPVTYKNNCLQNPDVPGAPRNGYRYLTFEFTTDEPSINDVFYTSFAGDFAFGLGVSGGSASRYQIYQARDGGTAWTAANFPAADCLPTYCPVDFTPTDSGWLPLAAAQPRMLFIKRGWGYGNYITGAGRLVEPVVSSAQDTPAQVAAEQAHHTGLMTALAAESIAAGSGEIKNAAFFTPLAGSLRTAHDYFAGRLSGAARSPVTQSCQRNYVVLATDGNPTGRFDGTQYQPSQWLNSRDADGNWLYGQAQQDVFTEIGAFSRGGTPIGGLRATSLSGSNLSDNGLFNRRFDVQTYVIGLGDTLANESSIAALNRMAQIGGGYPQAFLGSTSAAVEAAFQTIVSSIEQKQGGSSSATLNGASLDTGSTLYQATFDSSRWSGDLRAYRIAATGLPSPTAQWSAAAMLAARDWNGGRTLLTARPDGAGGPKGIAFRWPADATAPLPTELAASQVAALNTGATGSVDNLGALRLRYLRGDRTQECAACSPAFRDRGSPAGLPPGTPRGPTLGDLVDSAPVLVGAPSSSYYDDLEASAYGSFASAQRSRKKVLYVGGNDGMLHAFSADGADAGSELLGFVPSPLVGTLSQLTSPGYQHRFYADGTPTVGDAFYDGGWKTLLVSGMRAGAKGVFALDVTNPAAFSESAASNIVRWEFLNTQDDDMGHVFSQPVVVKTNDGRWSVVVANGYNSGDNVGSRSSGHAVLFVLDAETGDVVKKIDTGAGSVLSPNGLSGPAVVDTNDDGIADVVYAGDLNGNLWKFDLSGASPASWAVGNGGLALFNTDEANRTAGARPITSRPDVTAFPAGGYMVVFGSGRYLSSSDASSTAQQSLYGIWDDPRRPGSVAKSSLVQQSVAATASGADGALYRLTTHVVGTPADSLIVGDTPSVSRVDYIAGKRGWLLDLPTAGERAITDVRIRGGRAVFTTLIPNAADPCAYGGSGWLIELDVATGNRDDRGTFDTDNSGSVDTGDNLPFTAAGNSTASGRYFAGGIPAAPNSIVKSDTTPPSNGAPGRPSCVRVLYVAKSDGTTETVRVSCDATPFGRALWREVR